jgi:hypothetical protein
VRAFELVDDWALAPPRTATTERIAKPDVSRHLCLSVMNLPPN